VARSLEHFIAQVRRESSRLVPRNEALRCTRATRCSGSDVRFRGPELFGALLGFNAGVELGQLLVLALFLPLVGATLTRPALARYALPAVSAFVAASGAVWFALRIYALA
jgi:hypothetical protein